MMKRWPALAFALSLALGCSNGGTLSGDMGQGGGDMGQGGGGDMGINGPPGLTLLAGQLGGPGDADHPGTAARFYQAGGVAVDSTGTVYVADDGINNQIRRITILTGAVTSFNATNFDPSRVASDGAGTVYFTDSSGIGGQYVNKLVLGNGMITRLAGGGPAGADGTGSAAGFSGATGLVYDGAGSLYVADTNESAIRKVVIATGAVTTLAGSTTMGPGSTDGTGSAARFNQPQGVALDGAGNLYVADTGNATIRKIVIATAAVTTIAGTPLMTGSADGTGAAARFFQPQSLATDGAGNLYVADSGNRKLRQVVAATGVVTTLAGGGVAGADGTGVAAGFTVPLDVAWDGAANLYVADRYSIRKVVAATGAVTTFAGASLHPGSADGVGAAAQFSGPEGLAADGAGNVYVADMKNGTIRKIGIATGAVTTLAGMAGVGGTSDGTGSAARFLGPSGLAADGAGNLYVSDSSACIIRKIVLATAVVTTIAGTAGMCGSQDGTGTAARLSSAHDLAYDGAGNLYSLEFAALRKVVVATGVVTTVPVTVGFSQAQAVAADGAGNVYIADTQGHRILQVTAATGATSTLAGTNGQMGTADGTGMAALFSYPRGLALDGAGNLYVADSSLALGVFVGTIRKIVLSTATVTTVVGVVGQPGVFPGPFPAGLNQPWGLAWVPGQGLAIADNTENAVLFAHGL